MAVFTATVFFPGKKKTNRPVLTSCETGLSRAMDRDRIEAAVFLAAKENSSGKDSYEKTRK